MAYHLDLRPLLRPPQAFILSELPRQDPQAVLVLPVRHIQYSSLDPERTEAPESQGLDCLSAEQTHTHGRMRG